MSRESVRKNYIINFLFFKKQSSSTSGSSIKITVLGKGVVGKSSLTYRFINYNAPQEHDPTIEDRYKCSVNINGVDNDVEILDTAGEEDYQNMIDMWINFGDGFLLVFAINDYESFEILKKKQERILKAKHGDPCPILLAGNKSDLESERKVPADEAKKLASSWGAEYIETSAKTNVNCKEAFEKLAQKIAEKKVGSSKQKSGCCCNII